MARAFQRVGRASQRLAGASEAGLRGRGTDRCTDRLMDRKIPPVFYRTLSPLGPLPCFLSLHFTIMQSRATGIADHILPLGDLLYLE